MQSQSFRRISRLFPLALLSFAQLSISGHLALAQEAGGYGGGAAGAGGSYDAGEYGGGGYGGGGYGAAAGGGGMGPSMGSDGGYGGGGSSYGEGDYGGPAAPPFPRDFQEHLGGKIPTGLSQLKKTQPSKIYWVDYRMGSFSPTRRNYHFAQSGGMGGYGGMGGAGYGGGYGGEGGGYGGDGGMGADYGGEGGMMDGGYGGMEMGMGGPSSRQRSAKKLTMYAVVYTSKSDTLPNVFVLAPLTKSNKRRQESTYSVRENLEQFAKTPVEQNELSIVVDMIQQSIWKEALVEAIREPGLSDEAVNASEAKLRKVLTDQYDTQLRRQEHEVQQIETRVIALRRELQRRKAAKARVVDVKLGRIVLEAQGLLEDVGSRR